MNQTATAEATVGQLVAEKPSRSRVFEKLGIDYCCGGKIPLSEACAKKNLDPGTVLAMLEATEGGAASVQDQDPAGMTLTQLCTHIVEVHHDYLREELPRIEHLAQKVAKTHGGKWTWTVELAEVFGELQEELTQHMMKEERVLFPSICDLEAGRTPRTACGNHLHGPISVMEDEHDSAGRALARMSELSNHYQAPEGACNTFRALLDALAFLEKDLHQHIHKENNILFPKAMERFCS
ncbi:MAG: iron-sulfur cluster repair di-iron protein [Verrucomicrobiota bacterium]|jgi:regulator of cell morphogenesis and NO signaling|nr:iron-sulfur cluster repair di-iron protein [Verrucomicrobiota bacterium]MDI9383316.1 iron-sulfur cluster repair di-iron protein [Verrucomicrobiota bacterium]